MFELKCNEFSGFMNLAMENRNETTVL